MGALHAAAAHFFGGSETKEAEKNIGFKYPCSPPVRSPQIAGACPIETDVPGSLKSMGEQKPPVRTICVPWLCSALVPVFPLVLSRSHSTHFPISAKVFLSPFQQSPGLAIAYPPGNDITCILKRMVADPARAFVRCMCERGCPRVLRRTLVWSVCSRIGGIHGRLDLKYMVSERRICSV